MKIRIRTATAPGERGVALLYAIFGAFAAAGMVSLMLAMGTVTNDQAALKREQVEGRYLTEGAIEFARKEIQTALANWGQPRANGSVRIGGVDVPYTVRTTGGDAVVTTPDGIQQRTVGYEVRAVTEVGGSSVESYRVINAVSTPIFQFAVFYTEDLEVLPGPDMTLGGRVHTNGDMYLGSGGVLTMDTNYVRSVGNMYRLRKNETSASGDVMIRKYVDNPFDLSEPEEYVRMDSEDQLAADYGIDTISGYDSNFTNGHDADGDGSYYGEGDLLPFVQGALEFWSEPDGYTGSGNTVLTGEHQVTEAVAPSIGSIKLYEEVESGGDFIEDPTNPGHYIPAPAGLGTHNKGFFYENADLAVVVDIDGGLTIYDGQGNDITSAAEGSIELGEILDTRQSQSTSDTTDLVVIDLEALQNTLQDIWPGNGLIYVGHEGMDEGVGAKSVKLINGFELETALTTVCEGQVYIEGDFNTLNKKGAAVIGDAVSLLSNDWDDSKVAGATLTRASETTYNVAIITGNQETVGNDYNGGLENLPRFHENWTGIGCNISGSFVNAWESDWATEPWSYGGDRYKAPHRNWNYDPDFNDAANLPPFTPLTVTASDVVSW